jgi:hypothetical protein
MFWESAGGSAHLGHSAKISFYFLCFFCASVSCFTVGLSYNWHGQPKIKVNTVCRTVRERQYYVERETDLSVLIKTVFFCFTVKSVSVKGFREPM